MVRVEDVPVSRGVRILFHLSNSDIRFVARLSRVSIRVTGSAVVVVVVVVALDTVNVPGG